MFQRGGTFMVADQSHELSGTPGRNDSTLISAWPAKFDIKNDIFLPGKVDSFIRELDAALALASERRTQFVCDATRDDDLGEIS